MGGEILPIMLTGFDAILSCRQIEDFELIPTVKAFLWLPFEDIAVLPGALIINLGRTFIENTSGLSSKLKVLIHCSAGHNRSGLIVADYLIVNLKMKSQDAIDLIRSKRPGALTNQTFVNYLLSLGSSV